MYLQKVISKKNFVDVLKVTDENSRVRIRIRIHQSEVWIRGSGSGSIPKFNGSATLVAWMLTVQWGPINECALRSACMFIVQCV
jgi:hypothetical protein